MEQDFDYVPYTDVQTTALQPGTWLVLDQIDPVGYHIRKHPNVQQGQVLARIREEQTATAMYVDVYPLATEAVPVDQLDSQPSTPVWIWTKDGTEADPDPARLDWYAVAGLYLHPQDTVQDDPVQPPQDHPFKPGGIFTPVEEDGLRLGFNMDHLLRRSRPDLLFNQLPKDRQVQRTYAQLQAVVVDQHGVKVVPKKQVPDGYIQTDQYPVYSPAPVEEGPDPYATIPGLQAATAIESLGDALRSLGPMVEPEDPNTDNSIAAFFDKLVEATGRTTKTAPSYTVLVSEGDGQVRVLQPKTGTPLYLLLRSMLDPTYDPFAYRPTKDQGTSHYSPTEDT